MFWIGRKKIAFIPLYRTHPAAQDQIPPDWHNDILRRVSYDPDPITGADRSLRAWVKAASSGRADADPIVLPMRSIDRVDVLPDALDGELRSSLEAQGFDHAVLVMLGGQSTGSNAGFWSRVAMVEHLGVWMMEILHGITEFKDLYVFGGEIDPPDREIATFDVMSAQSWAHPTIFTKVEFGWGDKGTIANHASPIASYDLQYIGLPQPPISGRWAAVKLGKEVPYILIEARKMNDPFEASIKSEGLIVYRVQTKNPYSNERPDRLLPVYLITTTALRVGESVTVDNGVIVAVTGSIVGGLTIRIDDPNRHLFERSKEMDFPEAASAPTACVVPGTGSESIVYRDEDSRLLHLWRDANGLTGRANLTRDSQAPPAVGNPYLYVDTLRNSEILLFRDDEGTVRSLYWSTGEVGMDNLSGTAGSPKAAGDPVGYHDPATDTHHITYQDEDGHLHELFCLGITPIEYGGNLTATISAPPSAGVPSAFTTPNVNMVVYRSTTRQILCVSWRVGASNLDNLSAVAGSAPAAGDPVGYYTAHDDTVQIVYLGSDGHIWELYFQGNATVTGWDLTAISGAPKPAGALSAYYSAGTNTKHVVFRSANGRLHEIWWTPGGGTPAHVDVTAAYDLPLAGDRPVGFTVEGRNTQHVVYRGQDNHIYEVIWR